MLAKRAYLVKEESFEIREEELTPNDDQILVKVKLCGLCNWELNHWKGTSEEYRKKYPMVPGHEWVGHVVEVGKNVTGFEQGDVVTGHWQGAFGDYYLATERCCFKLSPDVVPENALGEPLKCIVTVLRAAKPEVGDFGLVLGCGPMGLWCTQGISGNLMGGLIAVDVDDEKLALALEYGATHVINPKKENVVERIREITGGRMCDFVIEGTGVPKLLNDAMTYLRNAGRLVLMSSHEDVCKEFDFRPAIARGISLHVAHPASSVNEADDMARAIALINRGAFHNEKVVSHRFKLKDINEAFKTLANKPKDYIKGIVEM